MVAIPHLLHVTNNIAQDASIAGVLDLGKKDLAAFLKSAQSNQKSLLICSGGTTSRCAATGHWILDLRNSHRQLDFDVLNQQVELGAGQTMDTLLKALASKQRSFPTGLSGLPGAGYILTGGISPLSRSQGLAVDHVLGFEGVWGHGECFALAKPEAGCSEQDQWRWRGLCGAAPFLAVITKLKLQTQKLHSLGIWQDSISPRQLSEAITTAESWPESASLQWIWGDTIKAYAVICKQDDSSSSPPLDQLIKSLPTTSTSSFETVAGLHQLPVFSLPKGNKKTEGRFHCEVLGLLGPTWGKASDEIISGLEMLMAERPDPRCCIAAQQLGGVTSQVTPTSSSFIHRDAEWKPWITAAWPAGDNQIRQQSLNWLERVWDHLQPHCQGVHLAQLHPHLPWHQKELSAAFGDWLPGLRELKELHDPNDVLPPL